MAKYKGKNMKWISLKLEFENKEIMLIIYNKYIFYFNDERQYNTFIIHLLQNIIRLFLSIENILLYTTTTHI